MPAFLSLVRMVSRALPDVPMDGDEPDHAALHHLPWRKQINLSSVLNRIEQFLEASRFERAPWLVASLAAGIAAWFTIPAPQQWLGFISGCLGLAFAALALPGFEARFPYLRQALVLVALALASGCALVWGKSALVGTTPIDRPVVAVLEGRVLERIERPAEQRVRLVLAAREPGGIRAIRVRVNLDQERDRIDIAEGAGVRLRARLMPPAAPMLPGGYDFARSAWFSGIAATGSVLGEVQVITPATRDGMLAPLKRGLSRHIRQNLEGSPGTIAAALASGDRGGIATADEDAMRDAGLTHLLSISGLHVSAVIAAGYFLALRLFALIPWLALRVRVPILAAASGAGLGIGYTLLTGAEVPTIRSCIAAVLVMLALVLGREPLSMRMVAVAAAIVLVFWPEALVGPSFQMSFAAVIAIVALYGAAPLKALTAPSEQTWLVKLLRGLAMLLLTGVVIELALMPIGLFHFHRAGIYGALANVIAIPLTTFVSMPLIALALLFDLVGIGAPFWWLAGKSLELLLALAHWTAARPGAVTSLPAMGGGAFALFLAGGLWLALWRGRVRLIGLAPVAVGLLMLANLRPPDVLISGDGRHVGITGEGPELLVLRESRSDYTRENLTEIAGMAGETKALASWPGARCNSDVCVVQLDRDGRTWSLMITRSKNMLAERQLAATCERVDVVIADRRLPGSCRPRWLKADRPYLDRSGGLALDLVESRLTSVAQGQGEHGWWQPRVRGSYSIRAEPQARSTNAGQPDDPASPAVLNSQ